MFYTIIIPVLNSINTIEKSIASVVENGFDDPYELFIFDGGSVDGTTEVIEKYKSKIHHYESSTDLGPQYAVNKGLKLANGEVIVFLCADDWLEKGVLKKIKDQFLIKNVDILSCGITIYDENNNIIKKFIEKKSLELNFNNVLKTPMSHGRFIKRKIYNRMGGFPTKFYLCNDLYFLLRIILDLKIKHDVFSTNAYNYLSHSSSATMGNNRINNYKTYYDNYCIALEFLEMNNLNLYKIYGFRLLMVKSILKMIIYKLIYNTKFNNKIKINREIIKSFYLFPFFLIHYFLSKLRIFIKP